MDKKLRLQQLYNRLREIDSSAESNNDQLPENNQPDIGGESLEQKKARLAELRGKLAQIEQKESPQDLSLQDRALQISRGALKGAGGMMDFARSTIPNFVMQNPNQHLDLLSGGTLTPAQIEELKSGQKESMPWSGSVQKEVTNAVDKIAGKDLTPTDTTGKFLEKFGEFGSIPGGTQWAPAIAAGSTALRELGLDESYSDLISAIGVPNAKALAQLPSKVLRKLGDYIATIGSKEYRRAGNVEKAAEFLQKKVGESNIPKVVENIENYETPFKGNIAEGEAAYRPVTADIADNVGISQYHRAKAENIPEIGKRRQTNAEVLQREIEKLAPTEANPQVAQEFARAERESYAAGLESENLVAKQAEESAAKKFEKVSTKENAGKEAQEYLEKRVSDIEKEAQAKASPLYKSAETKSIDGTPRNAFDYIEEQLRDNSKASLSHADMKNSKIAIENAANDSIKENKKLIASIKKKYKDDPKMMEIALKEAENVPRGAYNAGRLEKAKQEISKILESIPTKEKGRRRTLTNLLKELDKDMESIPEIFEARKVYREVMTPANVLTENPVLGKLIKKGDGYIRPFTVTAAEIPDRVIKGSRSIEGAKALMSEAAGAGAKEHKQMIETMKSYINSDILANFVETTGKVNPDKFKVWSKNNPGAFVLYPELKTKLSSLKNAQVHVNRVIKQNEELLSNYYKNSMESILGPKYEGMNPDKIASKILNSSNSEKVMEEAFELLSKDKSGKSLEGLRRGILQDLKMKFKSDNFTFATLNNYLKQHKKALSKAFNEDQIQVLENSKDLLRDIAKMERSGKVGGIPSTAPILMENLAEKTGDKASQALAGGKLSWLKDIIDFPEKLRDVGKLKYLEKALLDAKMAKFLIQKDTKSKMNFFDAIKNKESFGKWLRESESVAETFSKAAKDSNLAITSEYAAKAGVVDEF